MNELRATGRDWLARNVDAIVITLAGVRGSTPREAGCRMLVSATAQAGTIGGGNLEWQAVREARALLAAFASVGAASACAAAVVTAANANGNSDGDGSATPHEQALALGPATGQCCGGAVRLRYERLNAALLDQWPDEPALFRLHLFGAGHVASALVRTLAALPCIVHWHDGREAQLADAGTLASELKRSGAAFDLHLHACDDAPDASIARDHGFADGIGRGDLVLVMTHRHDLDLAICADVLRSGRAGFVGLIGSATKRARFARRLAQAGLPDSMIARLACPLAVGMTASKAPAALAIAIAAQLLQNAGCAGATASATRHEPPQLADAPA